ncbi:N-alpha-acetyltransferase 25, NatB auxiliary subunit isoform X1 [Takifugu rubripes]|uniref:N-alpha-acetyltransferase 25, NatB auxiliary subunit isoform X1 n=1 Tax=Takifugu rubripes TaxID=31033 RepID=UPI0005D15E3B|nr:N-alpha-acetyltransferase 25, NatB auxiliary subunit isoform X1 [Takifugu rubripes]|eukprot:XP_011603060.1 PREDICTED: N-alpha-acetyltransferase 25, NatB auxiliary subunit isoform X1 [Takifugu rubripes]
MAARGHVQDPNDRRLRPIYDYLDNGNNKMAIQQADKLLKKHKDLHCAKVLKAIGLQRTGKQDEAFSLAQEVSVLEPTDDNSLQALTILYREMHRPELVAKLYEAAVKKVPLSEEYHSHLFMAYARVGEYKKMQQAGMALYKIVPKNPYYFWSVMSLVMQAVSADDEKLAQTMFLPLAERMVEKMVKEEKIEAEAEVQLYFMILERLGKCEEALSVIRGPLGEKLTSELQSRETKCMRLYQRLQRWPECNALAHKLLLKNPDDWQFYPSYFDSLFHLVDQSWAPPAEGDHCSEGSVHHTVAEVVRFVEERIKEEEGKESRSLRGPYLARLELLHRLRERGCPEESLLGEPFELMVQFFGKFGEKPCCITDLILYLHLLAPEQHVQFINRLSEAVPLGEQGEEGFAFPEDTGALQRHLCVCQLSRALGLHHALNPEGKLRLIAELRAHYRHGLKFGSNALKTELQFSDMYCLMAAHVYIDLWRDTGDEDAVWQALGVLQDGLSRSASNAQFKLLLLLLYCHLGAFEPVVDLYYNLDAKHVQHDTIGFLLTRYAESLGHFAAASQSCNFSLRFFHSNQKDTSEYIIQAYKYGAFEKIPEFIALRNRLNHSLHFAQVRTERMLLDLFLEADIMLSLEESVKAMSLCAEEDDIPWDSIRDNRDLTVFTSWDPKERRLAEEHRRLSLEEETVWLRIRSLTLRLVASMASLGHTCAPQNAETANENGVGDKASVLSSLLSQLNQTLQTASQLVEKHIRYPFLGPPSTRLAPALSTGSCQCQAAALQLCVHLQELELLGLDESSELQTQICNGFKSLVVQLQEILNTCRGDLLEMKDGKLKTQPSLLENLIFFVETVCIVLWMASQCTKILRPLKTSLQKKKKKKRKETSTDVQPLVICGFQELTGNLQDLISQALLHIKGQETGMMALKLSSLHLEGHPLEEASFMKAAMDKVQSSYLHSLQEVGDLLKRRAETIKNLKI